MKTDPVFNLTFVGLVEKHPCLYDFNHSDYNNRSAQERAWETIASEVNESVTDCKEKWKNIRGCYTRYLKSVSASGSGAKAKQPYYLAEPLNFLLQFTKCRKSIEYLNSFEPSVSLDESAAYRDDDCSTGSSQEVYNLYEPENNSEIKEEHEFMTPSSNKRIKFVKESPAHPVQPTKEVLHYFQFKKELHAEKKTEDSDLAFLTSLLTDMKEMSSNQKRRFKIGILDLAGQILNEPTQPSSGPIFTPSSSCPSSPALSVGHQPQT